MLTFANVPPRVIRYRGHLVSWTGRFPAGSGLVRRRRCPSPRPLGRPATVLIRLRPRADAHVGFLALKQQMESLHRDLHERKILQGQLEEALAEKQVLLSEVHHRVKKTCRSSSARGQRVAQRRSLSRLQRPSLACRRRRGAGCCRCGPEVQGDRMRRDAPAITAELATVHCPRRRLDRRRVRGSSPRRGSCHIGRIDVTGLVINAYKLTFPERGAGNIRIGLSRSGGANTLTVADDGVPFPDAGDRSGTGLRIAQALARKLGGELEGEHRTPKIGQRYVPDP